MRSPEKFSLYRRKESKRDESPSQSPPMSCRDDPLRNTSSGQAMSGSKFEDVMVSATAFTGDKNFIIR